MSVVVAAPEQQGAARHQFAILPAQEYFRHVAFGETLPFLLRGEEKRPVPACHQRRRMPGETFQVPQHLLHLVLDVEGKQDSVGGGLDHGPHPGQRQPASFLA